MKEAEELQPEQGLTNTKVAKTKKHEKTNNKIYKNKTIIQTKSMNHISKLNTTSKEKFNEKK